jgi:hypothetical protein
MKCEIREVTRYQDVYISIDGTEFLDKDECERHESYLLESSIEFYDSEFNRTDLDNCVFANLDTDERVNAMLALLKYVGFQSYGIDGVGIYMYKYESKDKWINISEAVKKIKGEAEG